MLSIIITIHTLCEELEKDDDCEAAICIVIPVFPFPIYYFAQVSRELDCYLLIISISTFADFFLLPYDPFFRELSNLDIISTKVISLDLADAD